MKQLLLLATLLLPGFGLLSRERPEDPKQNNHASESPQVQGKIAYSYSLRGAKNQIYVINADGTGAPKSLTTDGENWKPAFNPAGTKIAFVSDRDGNREVYIMDADTGEPETNLTKNKDNDEDPGFSPDGGWIAFHSKRRENLYHIWVMDITGKIVRQRTGFENEPAAVKNTDNYGPAWGPGNPVSAGERIRQIAFHQASSKQIWIMNEDGENKRVLSNARGSNAAWSPDGSRIVFWAEEKGRSNIFVMDWDGANLTQVTDGKSKQRDPCWSADGKRIVFESNAGGTFDIYSVDAMAKLVVLLNDEGNAYKQGQMAARGLLRVTDFPGSETHPSCGP